jgi:hypothetical protein
MRFATGAVLLTIKQQTFAAAISKSHLKSQCGQTFSNAHRR